MGSNTSLQHNFARVRMKWGWLTCFVWRPDWAPSDTKLCWMGQGCWGWWSVGFSTGTKWGWGLDTERDCGGWRRWGWLTRTDAWASWFFRNFISTKCPKNDKNTFTHNASIARSIHNFEPSGVDHFIQRCCIEFRKKFPVMPSDVTQKRFILLWNTNKGRISTSTIHWDHRSKNAVTDTKYTLGRYGEFFLIPIERVN